MGIERPMRVKIISEDKPPKVKRDAPKKAAFPMRGTPEHRAILRKAIKNATSAFSAQDAYQPEEPVQEQDMAVVAALTNMANRSGANAEFMLQLRELVEAITGRQYKVCGRVFNIRYNFLAAFVPVAAIGGHNYGIGRLAVVIGQNFTGEGSLVPSNQFIGNCPPAQARRIDGSGVMVELVRPATDSEIDAMTDEHLAFIERNIQAILVPVE